MIRVKSRHTSLLEANEFIKTTVFVNRDRSYLLVKGDQ